METLRVTVLGESNLSANSSKKTNEIGVYTLTEKNDAVWNVKWPYLKYENILQICININASLRCYLFLRYFIGTANRRPSFPFAD